MFKNGLGRSACRRMVSYLDVDPKPKHARVEDKGELGVLSNDVSNKCPMGDERVP